MATEPFEVIAGPATVYIAPVGEPFPEINEEPTGQWTSLGRTDGGVTVKHTQDINLITVDQNLMPVKAIRTKAGLEVSCDLAEITLETYAKLLNDASVNKVAAGTGTPGYRSFDLTASVDLAQFALLVRGPSPYMDAYMDFRLERVIQSGEPEIKFVRDDKSVLSVTFTALEGDTPGKVGSIIAQDAAPL